MSSAIQRDVVLSAQRIVKSFGAQPVLNDISLSVHEGERIGLIGRNGGGKSPPLQIHAGRAAPAAGAPGAHHEAAVAAEPFGPPMLRVHDGPGPRRGDRWASGRV